MKTPGQRAKEHGTTLADVIRKSGWNRRTLEGWWTSGKPSKQWAFDALCKRAAREKK